MLPLKTMGSLILWSTMKDKVAEYFIRLSSRMPMVHHALHELNASKGDDS